MDNEQKEFMSTINGTEFQFRDFGVVMVNDDKLIHHGKVVLYIKENNFDEIVDAYKMSEYGTTDFETIMKMEGF